MGYESVRSPVALGAQPRIRALTASVRNVAIVLALLLFFGSAMVYSTTVYINIVKGAEPYYEFFRHLKMLAAGLVLSACGIAAYVAFTPVRRWARYVIPVLFLLSLAFVAMVKAANFGASANGADRWVSVGGITFQSSEVLKLSLVLYLAQLLCWWRRQPEEVARAREQGRQLSRRRPSWPHAPLACFIAIGLAAVLTVIQPDLGSTVIIVAAGIITLLLAGISKRQMIGIAVAVVAMGLSVFYVAPHFIPYVKQRIDTYHNPMENENAASFQITQAIGAVIEGGWTGQGYLNSTQKLNRLPYSDTDFVYPIVIEELGLLGGMAVMGLFLWLAWACSALAQRCRDPFHRTVAAAIGFTICLQAMVNIAVTLNVVPNSGLTLPFFSLGGTSLIVSMVSVSLVMAIGLSEIKMLRAETAFSASSGKAAAGSRRRMGAV